MQLTEIIVIIMVIRKHIISVISRHIQTFSHIQTPLCSLFVVVLAMAVLAVI